MKHYITDTDSMTWESLIAVALIAAIIFGIAAYKAVTFERKKHA